MKTVLISMLSLILMTSCNSQIDLEKLEIDENISSLIKKVDSIYENAPWGYNLIGYSTTEVSQFRYGNVYFEKFENSNLYPADYDYITLFVDEYDTNNLIGISIDLVNDEIALKLFDFLKKKYGEPEHRRREGMRENDREDAFLWYDNTDEQMIFFERDRNSRNKIGDYIWTTKCSILKKDLQIPLKGFKEEDMPRIEKMIEEFPKTLDILSNFKSQNDQIINQN